MDKYTVSEEREGELVDSMMDCIREATNANIKSIQENKRGRDLADAETVLNDARAEALGVLKGKVDQLGDHEVREGLTVLLQHSVHANTQNALYNIMMGADPVTGEMAKDAPAAEPSPQAGSKINKDTIPE